MTRFDSPAKAYLAARHLLAHGELRDAEMILRELVTGFPDDLKYNEALLEALFRQNKTGKMLNHFREITTRLNPTDDPGYHALYIDALRATATSPLPLRRMLRFYELIKRFLPALRLTGEVVECGCFRGLSSFLLCSYLRRQDPGFNGAGYHIFDSFQGLAEPTIDDEIPASHHDARRLQAMAGAGRFAAPLATVRRNLSAFPEIRYHPGWIPVTFRGLAVSTYRFVHVDVDLHDPTRDCLEYFYPKLAPGGVLVCDDYGWPGARKAIEKYCAERGVEFEITSYHQAVLAGT